jgi:hypothetical protein
VGVAAKEVVTSTSGLSLKDSPWAEWVFETEDSQTLTAALKNKKESLKVRYFRSDISKEKKEARFLTRASTAGMGEAELWAAAAVSSEACRRKRGGRQ